LNFEIIINQFLGKVNWPEIADYLLQVAEDWTIIEIPKENSNPKEFENETQTQTSL
jgi:hypothetical protein